jgi:hypothetical protein
MHWFWKVLIVLCFVLAIPSFIWFVKEVVARAKANKAPAAA